MRKILGITGIRSDYDLMSGLYRRLVSAPNTDFKLIVGGAHVSRTYGYSVDFIQQDGIPILATIESLIDADTKSARLKTASIMLQSACDIVANWHPDLIIYPGDREEVIIGAMIGIYLEIPTVHFYGGDYTASWHVDNPIRHAASKLSTFHVVATEEHRARLLAMGEPASRIRVLGNLSLDNFYCNDYIDAASLWQQLGAPPDIDKYGLVLFHPDPSERGKEAQICRNILLELKAACLGAFIGYPNTDPDNKTITEVFEEFRNEPRFLFYRTLGRKEFISLYKKAQFIIGNSSSGIVEAASIPVPAINVGLRQRGRRAGKNVIFVDPDRSAIRSGIAKAQDPAFRKLIAGMANPYGDGRSVDKAYDLIMNTDFLRLFQKTEDPLDLLSRQGAA